MIRIGLTPEVSATFQLVQTASLQMVQNLELGHLLPLLPDWVVEARVGNPEKGLKQIDFLLEDETVVTFLQTFGNGLVNVPHLYTNYNIEDSVQLELALAYTAALAEAVYAV